jgi:hypothetical protein
MYLMVSPLRLGVLTRFKADGNRIITVGKTRAESSGSTAPYPATLPFGPRRRSIHTLRALPSQRRLPIFQTGRRCVSLSRPAAVTARVAVFPTLSACHHFPIFRMRPAPALACDIRLSPVLAATSGRADAPPLRHPPCASSQFPRISRHRAAQFFPPRRCNAPPPPPRAHACLLALDLNTSSPSSLVPSTSATLKFQARQGVISLLPGSCCGLRACVV